MDISQQPDRRYMALHLITVPDAGMVQDGKKHQETVMLLECNSMTTLGHMITLELIVVFVVT